MNESSVFEYLAYSSTSSGLSSILHGLFAPQEKENDDDDDDDDDDFFFNTVPQPLLQWATDACFANAFLSNYTPLCDAIGTVFAWYFLLAQSWHKKQLTKLQHERNSFANPYQSAPCTYSVQLQEELYEWSRKTVTPWLS